VGDQATRMEGGPGYTPGVVKVPIGIAVTSCTIFWESRRNVLLVGLGLVQNDFTVILSP